MTPMPDRSATVRAYYAAHPEHFTADRHDENRRRSLPALIAHLETVHPDDRGQWGVLVKTDRNLKIPCDVIVWRPTGDHVDISDATGGIWGAHGPIHVNAGGHGIWFWAPPSVVDPSGEERALTPPPYDAPPDAGTIPPTPGTDPDLALAVDRLRLDIAELQATQEMLVKLLGQVLTQPDPAFPNYAGTITVPLPGWLGGSRQAPMVLKPEGQ